MEGYAEDALRHHLVSEDTITSESPCGALATQWVRCLVSRDTAVAFCRMCSGGGAVDMAKYKAALRLAEPPNLVPNLGDGVLVHAESRQVLVSADRCSRNSLPR